MNAEKEEKNLVDRPSFYVTTRISTLLLRQLTRKNTQGQAIEPALEAVGRQSTERRHPKNSLLRSRRRIQRRLEEQQKKRQEKNRSKSAVPNPRLFLLGKGTQRRKDGTVYDGDWKDDKRHGFGTLAMRLKSEKFDQYRT